MLKENTMASHLQPELPPISLRMCDADRWF